MTNQQASISISSSREFNDLSLDAKSLLSCYKFSSNKITFTRAAMISTIEVDCNVAREIIEEGFLNGSKLLIAIINQASDHAEQFFSNAQIQYLTGKKSEAITTAKNGSDWQALANAAVIALRKSA